MTESASPPDPAISDALRAGREALGRHAWEEAFELLSQADREGQLLGADLEALAEASFFAAHADLEVEVKERAFKAHLAAGDQLRAAYLALDLARGYTYQAKTSIASAWTRRAERLLDGRDESYAHGYVALIRSDVAKSAGDIDAALELAEQGVQIATRTGHADLQATALTALGTLKIATGDTSNGFALMEEASIAAVNGELSPFTTGVTCCTMMPLARDEFERLGATRDLAAAEKEIQAATERRTGPSTARKTFMFTDVVGSTNLAEMLGNESWERLLSWHDDLLRRLITKRRGEIVNSTGDGFFVAFDSGEQAIACARSIQQALAEHRRDSGFALSVRIGLHTAEANRRGGDYSGIGVHTAARVAALAGGGEILATAETLADAGDAGATDAREATLKGLTAPVSVASVTWA